MDHRSKPPLKVERVNDITYKVTDGAIVRTPASHGKWHGFETTKALAHVVNIGWPVGLHRWVAVCGPARYEGTFSQAKAAALKMARAQMDEAVHVTYDRVGWLNGAQADLVGGRAVMNNLPHIDEALAPVVFLLGWALLRLLA